MQQRSLAEFRRIKLRSAHLEKIRRFLLLSSFVGSEATNSEVLGKNPKKNHRKKKEEGKKSLSSSSHCLPLRHYAATSGSDVKTFLRSLEEVEGKKRITNQRATPDEGAEPRKPRRRLFVMTSQVTNSRAKSGAIKSRHLSESNNKTIKNNNKKNNKKNKIINKNRNNTIMKKTP